MIDLNRLRQIFGNPQSGPAIGGVNPSEGFPGMPFPQDPMIEANNDGTPIADEFLKAISEMPQRENPNIWRKLAAIGPAIAGNQQGMDNTLYGDFNRKMGDWKNRIQPLYQAAGLERMNNTQEMRELYNQQMMELRAQNLDRQTREGQARLEDADKRIAQGDKRLDETEANNKARRELDERRVKVMEYRMAHPNHQFRVDENGEFVAFNPQEPLATPVKMGIKSGELNDVEKSQLGLSNALRLIDARSDETLKQIEVRHQNELAQARERERLRTEREDKEKSDSQRQVERAMRIEKFKNENPQYRDLIDEEGQVKEPTSPGIGGAISRFMGSDLTPEVRAAIVKHIEEGAKFEVPGKSTPTVPNPSAANPTPSRFTTKPSAPANMGKTPVQMIGPDGKTYNVPADKVEQAKRDGMRLK